MAAKVARHFSLARASIIVFGVVALLTALFMIQMNQGQAAPTTPTDATKVPHYFGPWTNWALSPLTLPDATVTITGDGSRRRGGGHGGRQRRRHRHHRHQPRQRLHQRRRWRSPAPARTPRLRRRSPTAAPSSPSTSPPTARGYKAPVVTITGGGATEDATATAYGGVDSITLQNAGTRLPVPDGGLRHAGRPERRQGAGRGRQGPGQRRHHGDQHHQPRLRLRYRAQRRDPRRHTARPGRQRRRRRLRRRHHQRAGSVVLDTFGAGYTGPPTVTITDSVGNGSGATASATVDNGLVSAIDVTAAGTGYVTPGGIKKFQDQLPMLCNPASRIGPAAAPTPRPATSSASSRCVPEEKTYLDPDNSKIKSDEYEIALIQYRTKFNTDLPATLVRAYVQVETPSWVAAHPGVSQHVAARERAPQRHQGAGHDRRRAGLRRHLAAVARPGHPRDQEQAGAHRLPQPAAQRRRRRPLPADRQHADGLRHGPHGSAGPGRRGHGDGRGAQPHLHRGAQVAGLLQGQPRDAAPPRRHQPVDQRRYAAPVDHAGQRGHPVAGGRGRALRARHARGQRPRTTAS